MALHVSSQGGFNLEILWRDITTLGGAVFYGIVVVVMALLEEYALLRILIVGFLIQMVVVVGIRLLYFKNRPLKQRYHTIIERLDASSFPSWHAARGIFLSMFLGEVIGNETGKIVLLILGFLVCYSRIYLRKHDYWDVAAGAVLGAVVWSLL